MLLWGLWLKTSGGGWLLLALLQQAAPLSLPLALQLLAPRTGAAPVLQATAAALLPLPLLPSLWMTSTQPSRQSCGCSSSLQLQTRPLLQWHPLLPLALLGPLLLQPCSPAAAWQAVLQAARCHRRLRLHQPLLL